MTADFQRNQPLTADQLNASFANHADLRGGSWFTGPTYMWDGDDTTLSPDGTDYLQGACRGWTRDQITQQIQDTWLNPPGNIVYLPLTGGTLTGDLRLGKSGSGVQSRLWFDATGTNNISIGTVDGGWINTGSVITNVWNSLCLAPNVAAQQIPIGLNGIILGARVGDISGFGTVNMYDAGLNRVNRISLARFSRTSATEMSMQVLGNVGYVTITDGAGAPGAGASGGTGWAVNDRAYDALANTYTVMAVSGGVVTQLRQDKQVCCVTSQIVNPMALTAAPGYSGTGLSCNLTCTVPSSFRIDGPGDIFLNAALVRAVTALQVGDLAATRNCLLITRGAGSANVITIAGTGTGDIEFDSPVRVKGIAAGTTPLAGYTGEVMSVSVGTGTQVALTSGTYTQIATLALTAGDWDVTGSIGISNSGATTTQVYGAVTTVAPPGNPGLNGGICVNDYRNWPTLTTMPCGTVRVNSASVTNVYLVMMASYTAGSCSGWGYMKARRVR